MNSQKPVVTSQQASTIQNDWIVFFGEDWGRHNSTGQYLASALVEMKRVLWVNSIGLRVPKLDLADLRRIAQKLVDFFTSLATRPRSAVGEHEEQPGIIVAKPLAIPFLRSAIVRWINRRIVGQYLSGYLGSLSIDKPLVITACPSTADVMDNFGSCRRVYYCADEHSELPGMDRELVVELELALMKRVDVVICTSRALWNTKRELHSRVYYLPHGVNYSHMSRAVRHKEEAPQDLVGFSGPIVGYVGLIGEHLDLELVDFVAERLPWANFVMVGPVEVGLAWLPRRRNIVYLGAKTYREIPAYMSNVDLAILPWNSGARNRYANPTKLREYLAAGCAVVSTEHPEVMNLSADVYCVKNKEEFAERVRGLLEMHPQRSRAEISQSMAGHDWSVRAAELLRFVAGPE
ncbi:MAG: hypothetical protein A2W25_11590 [candidate division Zixibacteria bacterium RBG_16_53_22]|nr:MAG: hypothetical protein A2W25_11590 [candidate division Zixibacteria bacterium RBG_16_53_22]